MQSQSSDQEEFDQNVNVIGKRILNWLTGIGVLAAVLMSLIALIVASGDSTTTTVAGGPSMMGSAPKTPASQPTTARVAIDHVTRGCHNLAVNGGAANSPRATVHLAAGGQMIVQNDDVMPHLLVLRSGPTLQLVHPNMNHMGASSHITFPSPGIYRLTTKAGEDYHAGITTLGPDHTLQINVVVS